MRLYRDAHLSTIRHVFACVLSSRGSVVVGTSIQDSAKVYFPRPSTQDKGLTAKIMLPHYKQTVVSLIFLVGVTKHKPLTDKSRFSLPDASQTIEDVRTNGKPPYDVICATWVLNAPQAPIPPGK